MPDIIEPAEGAQPAEKPRVRVSSPASLLAVIPPLLGFEPSEPSLVVIGTEPSSAEVRITIRFDIPEARLAATVAGDAIRCLAGNCITTAAVVGYGPACLVDPVAGEVLRRFPKAGIALKEVLRAQDQRYWSYVCANPECCPPEGTPFDAKAHPAAAKFAGRPVLASRAALAHTIAPADGEKATAMRRATRAVERQVVRCVGRMGRAGHRVARRRLIAAAGQPMVVEAIRRYRCGEEIDLEFAAWVTVALRELRVRDDAWARMLPEHGGAHSRLWADLTRLAQPGYVAAPASLLAFVAWQQGDGALANVALDRALADSRRYSMAKLLRRALDSGAPPSMARLPMSPEEVAASYDAQEAGAEPGPAGAVEVAEVG